MLLVNLLTEFTNLFTQMHWIVILLLCLGVVCCFIEAIIPGFGFFGVTGILCEIAAIVVHAVFSGSALQATMLTLIVVLTVVLIFLLFIRSAKHGLLAKTAIVENRTALPTDFRKKAEEELKSLIGKEGLAITECRPVGKIRIDQETFEAQSVGKVIPKGDVVKVVAIEDARIMIDKLSY